MILSKDFTKLVIFDMDGVIIDSEPIYREIEQQIFKDLNIQITNEEYDDFVGLGLDSMWRSIKQKKNISRSVDQLIEMNNEVVFNEFNKIEQLNTTTNFISFLNLCLQNGIKTAIASSTPRKIIELILSKLNIKLKFDFIISGEEVKKGKPDPDIFVTVATKLNIDSKNCIVIEDSENGVLAAKAADMLCIGYKNPNSGNQNLTESDHIISDFSEIVLN